MADETKVETQAPDLGKLVTDALAKHGDNTSALKAIIADNYALKDDLKAARAAAPKEGSIVLSGDDAKAWGAYQSLGKPSDLRKITDEHGTLSAENAGLKWGEVIRTVADKAGVKPAVLKTLAAPTLVFGETKIKGKDGKETAVVTVKDGEAEPVPFDDYAAAKWGEFLPALKPEAKAAPERPNWTPDRTDRTRQFQPPPGEEADLASQILAAGFASY